MISKERAVNSTHGETFHHVSETNSDGTPLRARVNGRCKTWKRDPKRFRLPMKHGMYNYFYIEPRNAHEWRPGYGS